MSEFRWIIREDVPCWHKLSWNREAKRLSIKIHQGIVPGLYNMTGSEPIVEFWQKRFSLGTFGTDLFSGFGFGRRLKFNGLDHEGFLELQCDFPRLVQLSDEPCIFCKESNEYDSYGNVCVNCHGTGKERAYNARLGRVVSVNLMILFNRINYPEKILTTSATSPQLMTIDIGVQEGVDGCPISATISLALRKWLASRNRDVIIPEVQETIREVYNHLLLRQKEAIYFGIRLRDTGLLHLSCPGDACGLDPGIHEYTSQIVEGYKLLPHNIDSVAQQLCLLVGLVRLNDLFSEE